MTTTQTQLRRDTATNLAAATPTAGEPFYDSTNKRLGVGDGATSGGLPHASAADIQKQTFVFPTVGGTGNAITLTNTPPVLSYTNLNQVFKATAGSTAGVTVNVDSLGVKNLYKMNNGALAALASGDIVNGGIYEIYYDGTQFQIKALSEGPYTAGALHYLGTATASNSATIDLTSLLSATYNNYLILLNSVTLGTATAKLNIRFSTDNSTFDAGSNYNYSYTGYSSGGNSLTGHGAAANLIQLGSVVRNGSPGFNGSINIYDANNSSAPRMFNGCLSYRDDSTADIDTITVGGEWNNTANVLEAVRFFASSGLITTGIFKIYGISNS